MYYEDSLDPGPAENSDRPAHVPAKFWDAANGQVRVDALLKAYGDLERRMGGMAQAALSPSPSEDGAAARPDGGPPARHEDYCIECRHPMLNSDPDLNRRLHEAGFSQSQAQLVYDLAHERVIPAFERLSEDYESSTHLNRLRDHFGGDAKWNETARQIAAWGRTNLPETVYQALAATPDGIIAMRHMMASGEPGLGAMPAPRDEEPGEDELKRMMQDPRYWKKRDPAFIDKVSAGFRRIYGD